MYVCTYVRMYVGTYVCMYLFIYVCMQICMYAYVHICLCNISRMHGATQFWHSVGWCLFQKPTAPKTGLVGVQEWYTLYMVLQYMWKIWRTNMGEPTIKHSSGRSRSKGLRKGHTIQHHMWQIHTNSVTRNVNKPTWRNEFRANPRCETPTNAFQVEFQKCRWNNREMP